jgi:hypothetical protein
VLALAIDHGVAQAGGQFRILLGRVVLRSAVQFDPALAEQPLESLAAGLEQALNVGDRRGSGPVEVHTRLLAGMLLDRIGVAWALAIIAAPMVWYMATVYFLHGRLLALPKRF